MFFIKKNLVNLRCVTDKRLRTINFTTDDIEKTIACLNPNKAHGYDNISIRTLKICGNTICKPLELIFKQAVTTGVFPSEWKKGEKCCPLAIPFVIPSSLSSSYLRKNF